MTKQHIHRVPEGGRVVWCVLAALVLASGLAAAPLLQDTVERPRQVGAAGFTSISVGSVTLRGTLGQPIVGVSANGGVTVGHGFWHGGRGETGHAVYLPILLLNR